MTANRRLGWFASLVLLVGSGCPRSPEDGRPRGGGPGADAGNYRIDAIDPPSKLDGTKDLSPFRPGADESPAPSPVH